MNLSTSSGGGGILAARSTPGRDVGSSSETSSEAPALTGTLADRVAQLLAADIRNRVYPAHARLPTEQAMTTQYGVSRTVIREAISRLKYEGLVETRQGSGTVVLPGGTAEAFRLRPEDGRDPGEGVVRILELRRGIEAEMAALAAARRTAAELGTMRQALDAIVAAVQGGGDGVREDLAFHAAIARATHNHHYADLLGMLTRSLHDAIRVTRTNEARQPALTAQVNAEHEALYAAIAAQDTAAARTAAFGHMQNTEARLRQAGQAFWQGDSGLAAQRLARVRLGTELRAAARPKPRGTATRRGSQAG